MVDTRRSPTHWQRPLPARSPAGKSGAATRALVGRALAGDAQAKQQLARRLACVQAFVRGCNRRMGRPLPEQELDDAAQSAFIAIWTKLDRYDGQRDLEGWAFGFCTREVLAAARRWRSTCPLRPEDTTVDPVAAGPDPVDCAAVERAVRELDRPEAEVVWLKHFAGSTFRQIALELGMPIGSVKTHYYRAIGRLRVRLAALWRTLR